MSIPRLAIEEMKNRFSDPVLAELSLYVAFEIGMRLSQSAAAIIMLRVPRAGSMSLSFADV